MFTKLTPNLMVKDVKETIIFYQTKLGFKLEMAVPESQDCILTELPEDKKLVYALVKQGQVEIMFQSQDNLKQDITALAPFEIGASVSFYSEVENLKAYYEKLKNSVAIVKDYATAWYGMDEFYIRDNNGYILGFAQQKEKNEKD